MEVSLREYLFLPTKINFDSVSQGIDNVGVLRNPLARTERFVSKSATDSVCDIGHVPWLFVCVIKG